MSPHCSLVTSNPPVKYCAMQYIAQSCKGIFQPQKFYGKQQQLISVSVLQSETLNIHYTVCIDFIYIVCFCTQFCYTNKCLVPVRYVNKFVMYLCCDSFNALLMLMFNVLLMLVQFMRCNSTVVLLQCIRVPLPDDFHPLVISSSTMTSLVKEGFDVCSGIGYGDTLHR